MQTERGEAPARAGFGRRRRGPRTIWLLALSAAVLLAGCSDKRGDGGGDSSTVVVYTSIDEPFARDILKQFEQESRIRVEALYDSEAGKTTGFLRRIMREREHPRCDVWWSSEVYGTIELARQDLLEPFESEAAGDIPAEWRDPQHRWVGVAARARVLAYNTQRVLPESLPRTWRGVGTGEWGKRLALANPQFGTTRGHIAALVAFWGSEPTRAFLQTLRDAGAHLADGNSQAVAMVASGAADICMTDTDDVWVAQRRGLPIGLVYPAIDEQRPAIWIPCTVARVRGGPHAAAAQRLIDYLVSARVEERLAESDSHNVPVRPALRKRLETPGHLREKPQAHKFAAVADKLDEASTLIEQTLLH